MIDNKVELLRGLTIKKDEPRQASSGSGLPAWLKSSAVAVLMLSSLAIALLLGYQRFSPTTQVSAAPSVLPTEGGPTPDLAASPGAKQTGELTASGYVVVRRKSAIGSEITGKVTEVLVDEGSVVRKGQILARLDAVLATSDYESAKSRIASTEAGVEAIEADVAEAERIFGRTSELSSKQFASNADLTRTRARVEVLRGQLRQASAQLGTARLDAARSGAALEKAIIRSPIDGIVIERSAEPGEMVAPVAGGSGGFTRTAICTIIDLTSKEIEVDINEASISRVRSASPVTVVLDAYPSRVVSGTVTFIGETAYRDKATIKVRIGLDRDDPEFLPEMVAKVTFLNEIQVREQTLDRKQD